MPRVTILMPVFNGEPFLRETIDSVLSQTFYDFILLIINDGSTDNTRDIVLSYQDDRIRLVDNEHNMGLVDTLNKGIGLTETEYLARLDADDLWEETKLEKQISLLDSRPDVGLCGTSIHKFGLINGDMIFPINNDGLKVGFLFYCMMSHPSVVYRMSMLRKTGLLYKKEAFPAEDYKMWIDILQVSQIYNIPEPLVMYRQHENQICQEKKEVQRTKTEEVQTELFLRFFPDATTSDLDFYLHSYLDAKIESSNDYKQSTLWINRVLNANKRSQYANPHLLKGSLYKFLNANYKKYLYHKYFISRSFKNYLRYICSLEWRFLPIKQQLKLFLNK